MTPGISEMDLPSVPPARKRMRLSLKSRKSKNAEDLNNNAALPSSSTSSAGFISVSSSDVSMVLDGIPSEIDLGAFSTASSHTQSSCSSRHSTGSDGSTPRGSVSTSHCSSKSSLSSASYITISDSQSELRVPAVASLYNSGNTCFLNSVLQVLRYTPSFLNNLAYLYQDIQATERIKRRNRDGEEDDEDLDEDGDRKSWKVVKAVYKLYRDQSSLEQKYEEVASDDVMSMAVKPLRILDAVRDLNPMFEGSLQHDAQEFLRCLLCYLQDAEKCIQRFSSQLPHKFSPKTVLHPALQKLLNAAAQQNTEKQAKLTENIPIQTGVNNCLITNNEDISAVAGSDSIKINLFPKTEPNVGAIKSPIKTESKVGEIKSPVKTESKVGAIKSPVKIRVDPAEGDTADSVTDAMDTSQPCGAGMETVPSETRGNDDESKHTDIKQTTPSEMRGGNDDSKLADIKQTVRMVKKVQSKASQSKESVNCEHSSPIKTRSRFVTNVKERENLCMEIKSENDVVDNVKKNSSVLQNKIKQTNSVDKIRELKKGMMNDDDKGKVVRRRGRPPKIKGEDENKKAVNSTIPRRRGVKLDQQQQSDVTIKKTYSKKRLGMNGAVRKNSENLFDAMQSKESNDLTFESSKDSNGIIKDDSNTSSTCCEENDLSVPKVKKTEGVYKCRDKVDSGEIGKQSAADEQTDCLKSQSDSYSQLEPDDHLCNSYQDVYSHYMTTVADCGSDDTVSDSDSEDIVLKKKREKLIHQSPRRSPRKVVSEMVKPSPMKCIPTKVCFDSKSETKSVNKSNKLKAEITDNQNIERDVNANTNAVAHTSHSDGTQNTTDKVEGDVNANTNAVAHTSHSDGTQNTADKMEVFPVKCYSTSAISDSKSITKLGADSDLSDDMIGKDSNSSAAATHIPIQPFVKLENCDYVFSDNAKSVSARYAAECLTPSKLSPGRSPSAGNYLKQRNSLDGPDALDEAELQQALLEMINSPVKSRSKYDLTERLFQGTMMLRTCCLECESSWERQEAFHDISVPVRVDNTDSDSEGEHAASNDVSPPRSLLALIEASTEVERLQDNNKYFCDECCSKVEAERSIHYDGLPNILTLHLKRFSHDMGNLGTISKINDPVEVPLTLPCLRYKCPSSCLRPDHKYNLYAIISHSGATLSSGHYRAYVRALPKKSTSKLSLNPFTDIASTLEEKAETKQTDPAKSESATRHATRRQMGVAPKLPSRFNDDVVTDTKVKAFSSVAQKKTKPCITETVKTCDQFTSEWFECDDETVRVFDEAEFLDRLSGKDGCLLGSPYLLFYHKSTMTDSDSV